MKQLKLYFTALLLLAFVTACNDDEADPDTMMERPVAAFSSDKQAVSPGEEVQFTDETEAAIRSREWTFEGGSIETSNEKNPVVTWDEYGEYTVTLTVVNDRDESTEVKERYISVSHPIEAKNTALVNKLTATWCFACGSWGWDMFGDIVDNYSDDAVMMGTYYSEGDQYLFEPVALDLRDNTFPDQEYTPVFLANGIYQMERGSGGGINVQQSRQNVINKINKHKSAEVIAGVSFDTKIEDNVITVNSKVEFFKEVSGQYNIAVYLLEDGVVAPQRRGDGSMDQNAVHKYVLRAAFDDESMGQNIVSSEAHAGAGFFTKHELDVKGAWNMDNIRVAAVIWKMGGPTAEFVNAAW